ncbi:MAG: hypothetical protein LBI85_00895, partial [Spirochaetaceae bacterium]|nr:hypothetical protein [Spirochaetaceae bacterium]
RNLTREEEPLTTPKALTRGEIPYVCEVGEVGGDLLLVRVFREVRPSVCGGYLLLLAASSYLVYNVE